jgi:alpha/beta superfamily hydrolase
MPANESFVLAGKAGALEALLQLPEGEPRGAAVVCHAHPLHGGMMHFRAVFRAAKTIQGAGLACLRFNFRGVGASQGLHDHGRGEQDDVRTAVAELQRRFPRLPILLGGFSFGAVMALRVAATLEAVHWAFGLGFPLNSVEPPYPFEGFRKPLLFIQGENDVFGRGAEIRDLVSRLEISAPVVVVPGSDHFFTGHEDAMQQALGAWLATLS